MAGEIISVKPGSSPMSKEEQFTAKIIKYTILAIIIGLAAWNHERLLDTSQDILAFAQNAVHAIAIFAGLMLAYVILSSTQAKLLGRAIVYKLTSMMVDLSPIGVLKGIAQEIQSKVDEVRAAITNLNGADRKFAEQLKQKQREYEDAMTKAEIAQDQGDEEGVNTYAEIAEMKSRKIQQILEMQEHVVEGKDALNEVERRLKYDLVKLQAETEELMNDNDLAMTLAGAAAAAKGALGNANMDEIRLMAANNVRAKYARALGEMDSILQVTNDLGKEMDMEKMVLRTKGISKLKEMRDKKAQLGPVDTPRMLTAGNAQMQIGANKWANRQKTR
jgi:hypothetical protein